MGFQAMDGTHEWMANSAFFVKSSFAQLHVLVGTSFRLCAILVSCVFQSENLDSVLES